jgi:hypothetical protein
VKTKILHSLLALPALLVIATIIDCGGGSSTPPPPPPTGFSAQAQQWVADPAGGVQFLGYTTVQGGWLSDLAGAQGSAKFFSFFAQGFAHVSDGRAPARWRILAPIPCLAYLEPNDRDVAIGSNQLTRCVVSSVFLAADPSSVDLNSPPPSVTISGGGFSTNYGMPVVEYYDQYTGGLVASTTAYSVAADGSSLQASTPSLSGVYTGSYNIVVSNVLADGSNSIVGVATFAACCVDPPPPPPPPDPGGCPDGTICQIQ